MFHNLDEEISQNWMKHAFAKAEMALQMLEVPVGAVFVKHPRDQGGKFIWAEGVIVSSGHNLTNTHRNVSIY